MYPQIDTLEINPADFLINQNHESEFLFTNQAVPSSNCTIESLESWSDYTIESLEVATESENLVPDIPLGEIIPTVEAVNWHKKGHNVDIRPRLVDSSTGEARLLTTWMD